jgi:hypothetical protein
MSYPSIYGAADFQTNLWVQGFLPTSFTNTTAVFGPGSARSLNSDWVIQYPGLVPNVPGNITINTAVVGPNGTYPGTIAAITPGSGVQLAPVYLISNSAGTTDGGLNPGSKGPALVIATAATGFVPPGYDMYVCVGFVIVATSTGYLVPYAMSGNFNARSVMLQDAQSVLSAGAVVGPTAVSLSLLTPLATAIQNVALLYTFTPNSAADVATLIPYGLTSATKAPVQVKASGSAAVTGNVVLPVGLNAGVPTVNYGLTSTSDALSLWISGFTFNLPFAN